MIFRRFYPLLLLGFVIPAAKAAGQEQDTIVARPFTRGGVYDRPYLTRLLGRTAIGGYAEMHARWQRKEGVTEERGFELKRWILFTATDVSDFVRISAELEFEDGGEVIKIEFAAIDLFVAPSLTIRSGILLSPLGRFNLAHDSPLNEFTDRPLVSTELIGTTLSEPGLGIYGVFPVGTGRFTYEVYMVNGFHDGLINDSPDGTRVALGRGNFEDNNASPAVVGRVTWSPSVDFEIGFSGHRGAYNVYEDEGLAVDERRDLTIVAIDVDATVGPLRVAAEAATVDIDLPTTLTGVAYAGGQRGLYVEAMHDFGRQWVTTMPQSFFSVGLRFDLIDLDSDLPGDNTRQVTAGINFRPTLDTVLKLDYVRGTSRDRFNNPADHAGFLFSIATYF